MIVLKCVAGVVVSCKIPILATRVRFPGDAHTFYPSHLALPLSIGVGHVFRKPLPMWPNVKAKFIWIWNLNFRWILMDSAATVDSGGDNGKGYVKEPVPAWPNG